MINEIQMETNNVVEVIDKSTLEVDIGIKLVRQAGDAFANIVSSSRAVAEQVQELSAGAQQMSAGSQQVTASVEEITRIASVSAQSNQSIAASAQEQHAAMEGMTASANVLTEMAAELQEVLNKFRV